MSLSLVFHNNSQMGIGQTRIDDKSKFYFNNKKIYVFWIFLELTRITPSFSNINKNFKKKKYILRKKYRYIYRTLFIFSTEPMQR